MKNARIISESGLSLIPLKSALIELTEILYDVLVLENHEVDGSYFLSLEQEEQEKVLLALLYDKTHSPLLKEVEKELVQSLHGKVAVPF